MEIIVLPKRQAIQFTCDKPWAAISITNASGGHAVLKEENRIGLLQMEFDDVNNTAKGSFLAKHADEILAFAQEMIPKIEVLMVHCHAGLSRSPGVAAALYKLLTNGDDTYYFRSYTPNTKVYQTILRVAQRKGITPGKLIEND